MNFKTIIFSTTFATILLGAVPQMSGMKEEIKKETKQEESSLKKSFAKMIGATTTIGKIAIGAGGFFGGIWIWEGLSEYDKHKISAFIAGSLALAGGGGIVLWGVSDIVKDVAQKKK